jgi:hypothetical protein
MRAIKVTVENQPTVMAAAAELDVSKIVAGANCTFEELYDRNLLDGGTTYFVDLQTGNGVDGKSVGYFVSSILTFYSFAAPEKDTEWFEIVHKGSRPVIKDLPSEYQPLNADVSKLIKNMKKEYRNHEEL